MKWAIKKGSCLFERFNYVIIYYNHCWTKTLKKAVKFEVAVHSWGEVQVFY